VISEEMEAAGGLPLIRPSGTEGKLCTACPLRRRKAVLCETPPSLSRKGRRESQRRCAAYPSYKNLAHTCDVQCGKIGVWMTDFRYNHELKKELTIVGGAGRWHSPDCPITLFFCCFLLIR
jgi:hypothetical protein